MLVFVDESGDPGFAIERGASPVFVAAMVVFQDGENARATEAVVRRVASELRIGKEFKFNKSSLQVRDGFFEALQSCPFRVRAIVVRKGIIRSAHLKPDKDDFYRFFVRQLMTHDGGVLEGARVIIDGSGDRAFRTALRTYLRRQLGDKLTTVRFANSRNDPLIQLADMCAGAIARSYRTDRQEHDRWRRILQPRIDDVWEFQ